MIRKAELTDSGAICKIYNHYIENTIVTFEEAPVSKPEMTARISAVLDESFPWLVYCSDQQVLGYAYAGPWKSRSAYNYSVEVTVYLDHNFTGKGIGSALYTSLISDIKEKGMHAVFGGIALPNEASIALHEKLGFSKVAHFKEVGFKFGQWIDVGYWELLLDKK